MLVLVLYVCILFVLLLLVVVLCVIVIRVIDSIIVIIIRSRISMFSLIRSLISSVFILPIRILMCDIMVVHIINSFSVLLGCFSISHMCSHITSIVSMCCYSCDILKLVLVVWWLIETN